MDSRKIYITKVQREDTNAMGESIRQRGKREPYHQNSRECKRGT